jgi:nucleotide-binding universal stress UspA family protein
MHVREKARMDSQRRFEKLISQNAPMAIRPEFTVKFGIPGDQVLLASHALKADLIILGLRLGAHTETASHMPWDVAYKVVCGARCPVLTIRH